MKGERFCLKELLLIPCCFACVPSSRTEDNITVVAGGIHSGQLSAECSLDWYIAAGRHLCRVMLIFYGHGNLFVLS